MFRSRFDYLNEEELRLLDQSQLTVNLLHEVAALREEVEERRLKELKQSKMIQEQYDSTNQFIGNILGKMIEQAESKLS